MTRARQLVSAGLRLASSRAQPASASPLVTPSTLSTFTYASIYRTQLTQFLRSARTRPAMAARMFSTTPAQAHGHVHKPKPGEELYITFIDKDGSEHKFAVAAGDNLMDIAQANDVEMEGACGGSCACSTCHIIVDEEAYDKMPEPDDDENDMLDLAFGLTETSRLGCQVIMTKELDGLVVRLPSMTRNLQASDFESKAAA